VLKFLVLGLKVFFFLMLYMLVRWTIPRFRFDQLMALAWQVMIPLAMINLLCVMAAKEYGLSPWVLTVASVVTFVVAAIIATRERATIIQRPAREPLAA
jgi:NADH-quinone oxidoreductase subunit H